MSTAIAKAKPLKKKTRRDQRIKRARAKTALAVTSALVRGMLNETRRCLTFNNERYIKQADKVQRWADECLNLREMDLGRRSLEQAYTATHRVHEQINEYISDRGPHGIGHYAVAWVSLGYFVDEANRKFVETPKIKRRWNFLASTTNTFAEMFLAEAEEDRDYEAMAGEIAEKAWSSIFEIPRDSWVKL